MSSPTHASTELPAVDERLIAPNCGYEIDDGKLVPVPPADEPHAECHSRLAALLEAHVAAEFNVAIDMLTRTSWTSDLAPDASVYPRARDSRTGGRQLEHLAFEIVSTESLGHSGRKAASLVGRGVRRVFAIDLEHVRAFEWSRELESWRVLDRRTSIVDPALVVPLPVSALLQTAKADDTVAAALLAKRNPVIEAALSDAELRGGRAFLLRQLRQRFGDEVHAHVEQRIAAAPAEQIDLWASRVLSAATLSELLAAAAATGSP
jgi:Uma2 family endonuclease